MTQVFDDCFSIIIKDEGGFTNSPKDSGNWTSGIVGVGEIRGTKYGISAASFPTLDIANLTLDQAKQIYYDNYWVPVNCDNMPSSIALMLFDFHVNAGSHAVKILQECLGVTADGEVGSGTMAALEQTDISSQIDTYTDARKAYYKTLSAYSLYGDGWDNRSDYIASVAHSWVS